MIAILAYGSLIEDPGSELKPLIRDRKKIDRTPFNIEFARTSGTRHGAPTVVPVVGMGAAVSAELIVLNKEVSELEAQDMLWRRELRLEGSDKSYFHLENPGKNELIVGRLSKYCGIETVLYAKFQRNIDELSGESLAKLAIVSAKTDSGQNRKDGISYLLNVKKRGVVTPLMSDYERSILVQTETSSLEEALDICRSQGRPASQ